MPRVATYAPGQVQNEALRTPRATAASFGGNQAAAIQELGQAGVRGGLGMLDAAQRQQKQADNLAVRDTLNSARAETRDYLNNNVYNLQGSAALNAVPGAEKMFTDIGKRHAEKLTSKSQKELFGMAYDGVVNTNAESLGSFQRRETERYKDATYKSSMENYFADGAANPYNEPGVAKLEADLTADVAHRNIGLGEETARAEVRKNVSAFYGNIVGTLSGTDPGAALKLMDKYKDKFEPHFYEDLRDRVQVRFERQTIERAAGGYVLEGLSRQAVEDEAQKLKSPDQKRLLLSEYDRKYQIQKEAKDEAGRAAALDATAQILSNPNAQIPDTLPQATQDSLRRLAKDRAAGTLRTDPQAYTKLIDLTRNPQEFARVDLAEYASKLSIDDFKTMAKIQQSIKKGSSTEEVFQLQSISTQVNDAFGDEKARKSKPEKYNAYMGYMNNIIAAIPKEERKRDRIQEEIKMALEPIILKDAGPLWFDKSVPRYQVEGDPEKYAALPSGLKGSGARRNPADPNQVVVPQANGSFAVFDNDGKPVLNSSGQQLIYKPKRR